MACISANAAALFIHLLSLLATFMGCRQNFRILHRKLEVKNHFLKCNVMDLTYKTDYAKSLKMIITISFIPIHR